MNNIARYFDEKADSWDSSHMLQNPVQGAVAALAGVNEDARVLDLGCGTGAMTPTYLALQAREVVGLDVAPGMIAQAQKKFAHQPSLDFRCQDVYEFDDEEGFDALVIYNAYPHFLDKERLVHKLASLARPEARFVVAHGMGRAMLNTHHGNVPSDISTPLRAAEVESEVWKQAFTIDTLVDAPRFYCFAGSLKEPSQQ